MSSQALHPSSLPPTAPFPWPVQACLHGALYSLRPLSGHQGHDKRDALGITGVPAQAWPPLLLDLWLGTECAHNTNHRYPLACLYASWFPNQVLYRAFSFGCGTKRKTKQDYKPHSRLLFSIHLQAILLLYFFILETHSAILISGYRLTRVHVP